MGMSYFAMSLMLMITVVGGLAENSARKKHHVIDACITGTCVIQERNIMRIGQTSPWYYQGVTEINWMAIETVTTNLQMSCMDRILHSGRGNHFTFVTRALSPASSL